MCSSQTPINAQILAGLQTQNSWRLTPATMAVHLTRQLPPDMRWISARHVRYISAKIASAIAQGRKYIIVSMPPRHGKTELISRWTPVWAFDRKPHQNVLLASYGAELATDSGRVVRDRMLEFKNSLRTTLRPDKQQVGHFITKAGGEMYAVGVGGAITGRGGHVLLLDDYIKSFEDAESPTQRDKAWDWFTSTFWSRREPGASVIILATRWNQDDIIGRIKHQFADEWEIIELPAIAGEADPLGREIGEALWPERYDLNELMSIKKQLGTYFWQALYQQQPIPRTSALIGGIWSEPIDIFPKTNLRFVRSWDFAGSQGMGDYTVGLLLGVDDRKGLFVVFDLIRKQLTASKIEELVKSTARADGPHVQIVIEEEPGSAGKAVIDNYVRKVLKGYSARGKRATGDSFVRAQPLIAAAEAGNLRMIRAPWNGDFIQEMKSFPDAPHDDQVIAAAQGFNFLNGKALGGATWGRSLPSSVVAAVRSRGGHTLTGATWGRSR